MESMPGCQGNLLGKDAVEMGAGSVLSPPTALGRPPPPPPRSPTNQLSTLDPHSVCCCRGAHAVCPFVSVPLATMT